MIKFSQKAMQKWNQIDDKVQLHLLEKYSAKFSSGIATILMFEEE